MKQDKFRDWLEIVGIFAVVVSLAFVGLQMRQTQEIAVAEMGWNNMIAEMESRSAIYEFPEIWAKGNAGETLNPIENHIKPVGIEVVLRNKFVRNWRCWMKGTVQTNECRSFPLPDKLNARFWPKADIRVILPFY